MGADRTQKFKEALRDKFMEVLGDKCKISIEEGWQMFKGAIDTVVTTVKKDAEMRLPLAGIGTFEIRMQKPRVPASVESQLVKAAGERGLPYFKFKLSDAKRKDLIKELTGIDVDALAGAKPPKVAPPKVASPGKKDI